MRRRAGFSKIAQSSFFEKAFTGTLTYVVMVPVFLRAKDSLRLKYRKIPE
jgi:hypothetical protein